jgi:hypothetical protein
MGAAERFLLLPEGLPNLIAEVASRSNNAQRHDAAEQSEFGVSNAPDVAPEHSVWLRHDQFLPGVMMPLPSGGNDAAGL